MKKLNKIEMIEFKSDFILLGDIHIRINDNIHEWMNTYCDLSYSTRRYMEKYPECEEFSFTDILGVYIYTENFIINRISIYPLLQMDNVYYQGDVIVFGKKIPKPFLSDDIEKYFTGIKIEQPIRGYFKRFKPHESVSYYINDTIEIEIMMSRDSKYVGGISLKIR